MCIPKNLHWFPVASDRQPAFSPDSVLIPSTVPVSIRRTAPIPWSDSGREQQNHPHIAPIWHSPFAPVPPADETPCRTSADRYSTAMARSLHLAACRFYSGLPSVACPLPAVPPPAFSTTSESALIPTGLRSSWPHTP